MADDPETTGQQQSDRTRFQPGTSGNPAGRPRGALNRTTMLARALLDGEAEALVRKAVEMALAGSEPIMRVLLDKLIPAARPQANLEGVALPPMASPRDLPAVCAVLLTALADGRVSLADVQPVLQIIETTAQAIHAHDLDGRITALERYAERLRVVR